ncbi:MAG: hypothetical protein WEB52_00665 [Dehalococcoidia bacterium]
MPTQRLDQRLESAAATAAARAGEPRFNGGILGFYIAPSVDDWPAELRDAYERTVAGGCTSAPAGQSELDFMMPLVLPAGFQRTGDEPHITPTDGPRSSHAAAGRRALRSSSRSRTMPAPRTSR